MHRWTKREEMIFRRDWLRDRMRHEWHGAPTTCRRCGVKFGPKADARTCPRRRKPNRWKLHVRRAELAAKYRREAPIVRSPAWILEQLHAISLEVRRDQRFEDLRFWKYHRLARRYRRLMREWWALPASPSGRFGAEADRDPWAAGFTRGRNQLIAEARRLQARELRKGDTTFTFYPHATTTDANGRQQPLFQDA